MLGDIKTYKLLEVIKKSFNKDNMLKEANSLLYGDAEHLIDKLLETYSFVSTTTIDNNTPKVTFIWENGLELITCERYDIHKVILGYITYAMTDNIEGYLSKTEFNKLTKFIDAVETIYILRLDILNNIDRLFLYFYHIDDLSDYYGEKYKSSCDYYNSNFDFFNKFAGTNFEKLKFVK